MTFQISPLTLATFCSTFDVTEYVVLLASLQLSLYLLGCSQEVTVGTAIVNRDSEIQKKTLGLFVNMVVICTKFTQATNFLSLLKQVKENLLDAMNNSLPLEYIETLLPTNKLFMQSLYQVMFSFQRSAEQPLTSSAFLKPTELLYHSRCESNIDIYGTLNKNALTMEIRYSTDLYVHNTIQKFVKLWENTLQVLLTNPYIYLRTLKAPALPSLVNTTSLPSLFQIPNTPSLALQVGCDQISWSRLRTLASSACKDLSQQASVTNVLNWPASCTSIAHSLGASVAGISTEFSHTTAFSSGFQVNSMGILHYSPNKMHISADCESVKLFPTCMSDLSWATLNDISAFSAILSDCKNSNFTRAAVFLGAHTPLLLVTHSLLLCGISVVVYNQTTMDSREIFVKDEIQLLVCPVELVASLTTHLTSTSSSQLKCLWIHGLLSGLTFLCQWSATVLPDTKVVVTHSLLPAVHHITHYFDLASCKEELHNSSAYLSIGYASPSLQWSLVNVDGRKMQQGSVGAFTTHSPDGNQLHSQCLVRQLKGGTFQLIAMDMEAFYKGEDITPLLTALSKCSEICWSQLSDHERLDYYTTKKNALSSDQLVSYLKQRIVAHKIPSSICQVSSVPLTAEMFVDQARIQKESNPTNSCKEGCIVQNIVMKAVCNVLEIDNVQPCHSFHSLGGHSLLTICLASKLSQELGVKVDVKTVFKAPSLNHLVKDVHLLLSSKNHESTLCSCSTA